MSEQPSTALDKISVGPMIRQYGDECPSCGHHLRQVCECPCHLPWDDTRWVKVGAG